MTVLGLWTSLERGWETYKSVWELSTNGGGGGSIQAMFVFTGQSGQIGQQDSQVPTIHFLHSIIISSPFNRFTSGVTLTQLLGRLIGAVKPADSFIFTEACSTEICRPNPYEQSPGNIVGISHPSCANAAVTIAALGSGAITGCGITGCIYLDPLYPCFLPVTVKTRAL